MSEVELLAGRALRRGDPVAVLSLTSGTSSAEGLALRGAAFAQLDELDEAARCLSRAEHAAAAQGDGDLRVRAALALAEVALARRDLSESTSALERCVPLLRDQPGNLALSRVLRSRIALFRRDTAGAKRALSTAPHPPDDFTDALLSLAHAEVAIAMDDTLSCLKSLERASSCAERARHAFLLAEIEQAISRLHQPCATLHGATGPRVLSQLELMRWRREPSAAARIDGLISTLTLGTRAVSLAAKPIIFALLSALALRAPNAIERDELIQMLGVRRVNESHRATLRMDLSRLRRALPLGVRIETQGSAYQLVSERTVEVLVWRTASRDLALSGLLADGAAWRTEDVARALDVSHRTALRRLGALREAGETEALGNGQKVRWQATGAPRFSVWSQISSMWLAQPG